MISKRIYFETAIKLVSDHFIAVLDWPANSPQLNLVENLLGIVKRKMRNSQLRNANERYQSNLGFKNTSAGPKADHLNATLC